MTAATHIEEAPDTKAPHDLADLSLARCRLGTDGKRLMIRDEQDLLRVVQRGDAELIEGVGDIDHVPVVDHDQGRLGEDDIACPDGSAGRRGQYFLADGL